MQGNGRVHRMNQKEIQDIVILVMDESYDLILQSRLTQKFLPQIAGQASLKVDERIGTLPIEVSGPDSRAALIKAQAQNLFCNLFKQRAIFANYTDPTKLYSKRMSPRKVVRKTGLRADPKGGFQSRQLDQSLQEQDEQEKLGKRSNFTGGVRLGRAGCQLFCRLREKGLKRRRPVNTMATPFTTKNRAGNKSSAQPHLISVDLEAIRSQRH